MTALRFTSQCSKIIPTDKDVLTTSKVTIARRRFDNHPGNKMFNAAIDSNKATYQHPTTTKKVKTNLIDSIIDTVHKAGGRFLIVDDYGVWSELSARQLTDKVSHALRRGATIKRRKKLKPKNADVKREASSSGLFRLMEGVNPFGGVGSFDAVSSSSESDEDTADSARATNLAGVATLSTQQRHVSTPKGKGDVADHTSLSQWLQPTVDEGLGRGTLLIAYDDVIKRGESTSQQQHSYSRSQSQRPDNAVHQSTHSTEHELDADLAEEVLDLLSRTP